MSVAASARIARWIAAKSTLDAEGTEAGLTFALALTNLISAVGSLRNRDTGSTARILGRVALSLMLVAAVTAVIARLTYESAAMERGDIELVTEDVEFSTEVIETSSGKISVFVDNKDSMLHTFTVDDLDVDLQVPGDSTARVTFRAPKGIYEFLCTPHPDDMKTTLKVQ